MANYEAIEALSNSWQIRVHGGRGFGSPSPDLHYPPDLKLEPVHLAIRPLIDIDTESADMSVTMTVQANAASASAISLNGIDFKNLKADGGKHNVHLTYDGSIISLSWDKQFALGERREVTLTYRVERPISGLFFMKPTKEYPGRHYYAATDHETERARYWLACVDHPNVRTSLHWEITAKDSYTILANGAFAGEKKNANGTKTVSWKLDQRCPSYLVCFALGDFVSFDDGEVDGIHCKYFATADFKPEDLKISFGKTRDMLSWMTKKLGLAFPYPKYYQFALPEYSGAMENISLVSWNDKLLASTESKDEMTWLMDQINVHEMAHSYFGDLVVCRDFAHAWLKESWATYIETCWLEDSKGDDEKQYDLFRNARAYFSEADDNYKRPLVTRKFSSSWQMYDRHLYPGGACRLHTLRSEIGDDAFWAATRDYLKTYQESVVETDEFRRMMEKHTGRSLQKFFDQWIMTPAYPDIKVTFSYDKDKQEGTLVVEQKQVDAKKEIPAFAFNTQVSWHVGGKEFRRDISIEEQRHSFTFTMGAEPDQVRFDPDWQVLHKLEFNPGDTKLQAQLLAAKDVHGRIHAATTLAKTGKRENLRKLHEAYDKEKFWGVRREIAAAVGGCQSEESISILTKIIASEKDHLVLDAVFDAAKNFRDARISEAVVQRFEKGDLPPKARAAALKALGAQREQAPMRVLLDGLVKTEPRYGFGPQAAMVALGMSRQEDAADILMEQSHPGKMPYKARRGAADGLGILLPHLPKHMRRKYEECLVDLLRDGDDWMRRAAAGALCSARVKWADSALQSFRALLPQQDQVVLDDQVNSLRKDEDGRITSLEKQIDEVNGRYRKLLERLENLEGRAGKD
jgi:aminopeptidase N